MTHFEVRASRRVEASPKAVWAVLSDVENAPEVLRGVTRVEIVKGEGYGVGTEWLETRRILRMEETQRMWVTEADAARRTTVASESKGVHYTTVFTLAPDGGGTELGVTFRADQPDPRLAARLTATLFGRLGALFVRRMLRDDLDDIAARAEARPAR